MYQSTDDYDSGVRPPKQGCSKDFTLGAQKSSAQGARIEASNAPRGLGLGRG